MVMVKYNQSLAASAYFACSWSLSPSNHFKFFEATLVSFSPIRFILVSFSVILFLKIFSFLWVFVWHIDY